MELVSEMDVRDLGRIALASSGAGFGASAGRAAYKDISKNWVFYTVLAICFAGVGYACFDASRGHDRSPTKTIFVTLIGNILIVIISLVISLISLAIVTDSKSGFPWLFWLLVEIGSGLIGLLIGFSQRKVRLHNFNVARDNDLFLHRSGLRDLGGTEDTWIDGDDNELQLLDVRDDAVVFRVHGRRGVRALLKWDSEGRFIDYTGPINAKR